VDLIREWGQGVALAYHGITDKNEKSVQAVMTPACERRLIELPEAFMAAARQRLEAHPAQAAGLALRALAIEILTTYPFRLANLLGLRFDRHLHRADPRGPVTGILITPDETKNDNQITLPISARLGWFIEEWATRFRGVIASPGCLYLFPGHQTGNRAMTPQGMRDAIKSAMGEYVGVVLTPHQFRHLAAERFLTAYPGQYEALSQLLGHKDPATTRKSYCPRDKKEAARRFDALNASRRTTLRRKAALPTSRPPKPLSRKGGR
jgi:integrase